MIIDTSQDNLVKICDKIGTALAMEIDHSNPAEILGKLNELTNLLPTSSHAVALSEMIYAGKLSELINSTQYAGYSATDKKMVFGGRAKTEIYYVKLADRQNASLVHAIEALRSMLSYIKAELQHIPTN